MPGYIRINNQFQLNAKKLMFLKCKKTDMSAFLFCLSLNLATLALFLLKMSLTLCHFDTLCSHEAAEEAQFKESRRSSFYNRGILKCNDTTIP